MRPDLQNLTPERARLIDNTFIVTVTLKGLGGLIELLSAIFLVFISPGTLQHWLAPLEHVGINFGHDISSGAKLFAVFYFGSRGLLRMVLAVSLLRERMWAYPVTLIFLAVSVLYQTYLMLVGHFSTGLLALTLFDTLIIILTLFEWDKLKHGGHLSRPHL